MAGGLLYMGSNKSKYYDIELVDISDNVENFQFTKVSNSDLHKIIKSFRNKDDFLEFKSSEGNMLLSSRYYRGIMFVDHVEEKKTIYQENIENSIEIDKIKIKKNSALD